MIFALRFEVLVVVLVRIQVFRGVMLSCCRSGKQSMSSGTYNP